jgi:ElaB/YqjD/DUF883 family membrane-anchored ribosome-binding protein
MRQEYPSARDVARKELREVLASTEALLTALDEQDGPAITELRERLTATIADLKHELGSSFFSTARDTIGRARDTAVSVNDFVQERPWSAVVIAAGIGIVAGLILKD